MRRTDENAVPSRRAEWLSATRASEVIGCSSRQVAQLARSGQLTVKRLPGIKAQTRYLRADCEQLAEASITPARVSVGR